MLQDEAAAIAAGACAAAGAETYHGFWV